MATDADPDRSVTTVRLILADHFDDPRFITIDVDADLVATFDISSLDMIEVFAVLEEQTGSEPDLDEVADFRATVRSIGALFNGSIDL